MGAPTLTPSQSVGSNRRFGSSFLVLIWIAALLLIIAVALFVAAPLSDQHLAGAGLTAGAEAQNYDREHALAVQALRELEFDHAMGKLEGNEYRALRQKLESRALATVAAPRKTAGSLSAERRVESQPISVPRVATVNFCVQCGTRFDEGHKFCANCGAARPLTAPV